MNSATTSAACPIVPFRLPSRRRSGAKSGFALRLEGSLAAVATLAPVIPIFPGIALSHPAAKCHPMGDTLL